MSKIPNWHHIAYDADASLHFFFGDESAAPLFHELKERVLQEGKEYFGVLEAASGRSLQQGASRLLLDLAPPLAESPAGSAIQWLDRMHADCWATWRNATFYLSGSDALVQGFRQALLDRSVPPYQIRVIK